MELAFCSPWRTRCGGKEEGEGDLCWGYNKTNAVNYNYNLIPSLSPENSL